MKRILLPFCVTSLLMGAVGPLSAAPGPPGKQVKYAHLHIEADENETARLSLALHPEPADPWLLEQALDEALACRLQEVDQENDNGSWQLNARCDDTFRRRWLSRQAELNLAPLLTELRRLGQPELG